MKQTMENQSKESDLRENSTLLLIWMHYLKKRVKWERKLEPRELKEQVDI